MESFLVSCVKEFKVFGGAHDTLKHLIAKVKCRPVGLHV